MDFFFWKNSFHETKILTQNSKNYFIKRNFYFEIQNLKIKNIISNFETKNLFRNELKY